MSKLALLPAPDGPSSARARVRDGFLAGLSDALGFDWPRRLLVSRHGEVSFAEAALAEIETYRQIHGDEAASARRLDLVDGWQFLAAIERLRCAVEDGAPAEIIAAAKWAVRR